MFPFLSLALCMAAGVCVGLWLPAVFSPWWLLGADGVVLVALLCLAARRAGRPFRLSSLTWKPLLQSFCIPLCVFLLGATLCLRERRALSVEWPGGARPWTVVVASEPKATERSVSVDGWLRAGDLTRLVRLYLHPDSAAALLRPGLVVGVEARIGRPGEWRRGTFSYQRHMLARGVVGTAYVPADKWSVCGVGEPGRSEALSALSPLQRLRLRCLVWRHQLLQQWHGAAIDEADLSLLMAMTLGEKSRLSRRLQDDYSAVGASHVLALSGLHLGILACLLLLAVRKRVLLWLVCPLTVVLVWAFALLVGLPSSVVRAATMVSLLALLQTGARQSNALNSLGVAALAMLAHHPLSILDAGFQLSFLSLLSILAFTPLLRWWFHPFAQYFVWSWRSIPLWFSALRLLVGFVAVTLAAQVGTAPLVAYHFGRLPLHFLLSSLLVVPMAYAILFLALLMALLPWIRPWCVAALSWLAHTMNVGVGHIASWPYACIDDLHPRALTVVLLYVLLCVVGAMVWWMTLRRVAKHKS